MRNATHNAFLGKNTASTLSLILVIAFTAIGIWFGTPEPSADQTFAGTLRRFATDDKTRTILAFILVDIVTGVMCALRLRIFDIQRLAGFYASNVVPYILGYLLVWILTLLGLDGVLPVQLQAGLASLGSAAILTTLTGSILDNMQRMSAPLSYTEGDHMAARTPQDTQG